jgi:hypothetical protein
MKKIMFTEVMRPRSSSGVRVWRMMLRSTMLTVSAAPESARHTKASTKVGARPKAMVETP